ncbi:MAG: PQQ-binding-like beta-propeller repeat protein, partial [Pirellulales bacterium]|nr:PQQ-binding-like beta-propeller repeat protein [Pirellulales bacterium]
VVCLTVCFLVAAGVVAPSAGLAALSPAVTGVLVVGQFPLRGPRRAGETPEADVFPRPERALVRQLDNANKLIAQRRYGEAVRCLDVILRASEDYLYQPDDKKPRHRSLQAEANRILGSMPGEGRELYELQYGSEARQLLDRAVAKRDRDLLDEISRRFFHTAAGREATFLLGRYDLDHGEPLAAALTLQQLRDEASRADRFEPTLSVALATCWRRAGFPKKSADVLRRLCDRPSGATVRIAGREETYLAADVDRLAGLLVQADADTAGADDAKAQWMLPRRDAARTASAVAGRPLLEPVWTIPTSDHPTAATFLAAQSRYRVDRSVPMVPAMAPLALDDVVLMRSLRTLLAIDGTTGKRLWEVPVDDVLDESPDAYRTIFQQPGQLVGLLCQRVWRDGVYGALSSDGRRVFAVEDLGLCVPRQYGRRAMLEGGRRVGGAIWPRSSNRLAAYDIGTGKLAWHVGGSRKDYGLELAGAFFLGSPLTLSERLYALAEISGEIQLLSLEASSGKVLWSQRIAMVDRKILDSPVRRFSAVSPSYRDGVVVCPTASGAIVGVKLARRSLLWGYRYGQNAMARESQMPFASIPGGQATAPQWTDGNLVVVGDRVLATPPDSDEIHCLDLLDGKPIWKKPRDDGLYLAAVWNDAVVLVGMNRVRALSLADGKPAWGGRVIALPDGSVASGQGFRSGRHYYLPTSSAQLLVLDLESGVIEQSLDSASGTVPGNLVCCRDKIISQSIDGVSAFDQIEPLGERIAKALAENPDDAEALYRKGQLLLAEGRRGEAVACLRRSYQLAATPKCRRQLREALFGGLHYEFAEYQPALGEIEKLLDTQAQGIEYLRLLAEGCESQSAWTAAMECLLRMADSPGGYYNLIEIDRSHSVRDDRWLSAHLAEFRGMAPAEVVDELDRRIGERLAAAMRDEDAGAIERLVDCFGGQPGCGEALGELSRRYVASGHLLKAEALLRRRMRGASPSAAASALWELAEIFRQAGRTADAAACYRELEDRWGDVVCREGKTGRQLALAASADAAIGALIRPERRWPVGQTVLAKTEALPLEETNATIIPLPFEGGRDLFFEGCDGVIDQRGRAVSLLDRYGRRQWTAPVANTNRYYGGGSRDRNRMTGLGHLLVLSLDQRCVALDTAAGRQPRILWDKNILDPDADAANRVGMDAAQLAAQWGPRLVVNSVSASGGRPSLAATEVISDDYICCQRFRRCVAVDPISGEVLWTRRDLPTRCTLFGDADHVFLVPAGRSEAIVLDARDGRRLAEAKTVPPLQQWLATLGGRILRWRAEGGDMKLDLFDPWTGKSDWGPHGFSASARFGLLDDRAIGVMQPDGRFALFTLPDGRKLIDTRLDPALALDEVVLMDSGSGYLLVTSTRRDPIRRNSVRWRQIYGTASKMIQHGRVYAFDASGKRLWPEPGRTIDIDGHQLLLNQPVGLPVLTFAAQTYNPGVGGNQWITSVLMIDKRTGRTVVRDDYEDRVQRVTLLGNPDARTVTFAMQKQSLQVTFTDRPIPAGVPGVGAKPGGAKGSKTLDAMFKALKQASGG